MKTSKPAFPTQRFWDDGIAQVLKENREKLGLSIFDIQRAASAHPGMTMRQYYKAAALTGLLANTDLFNSLLKVAGQEERSGSSTATAFCASYADAMLAEDEQNGK